MVNDTSHEANNQSTPSSTTETIPSVNTSLSSASYELAIIRLNIHCEKLKNQVQELTEKLNESQTTAKHATDERDKYLQIYARTHDRFVAFEKKQLYQMRRLLTVLTSDQHKVLTENIGSKENSNDSSQIQSSVTNLSASDDSQSSKDSKTINDDDDTKLDAARYHKTEADWNELLTQMSNNHGREITQIMDLSQKFCDKCSQQREENNKLRILNTQKQDENVKLLFDLSLAKAEYEKEYQIRTQIEKQLAETTTIIDQLSNLTKKTEKNDTDLRDMKLHYDNLFAEQVNNIKKLVKERELLHLYIQRLETENASLVTITNDDETVKLLTYASQSPTTFEHLLNRDLNSAKDEIIVLRSLQTEYERVMSLKNNLEKQLDERANELKATKCAQVDEENAALRAQIQKLKVDFENTELVQHDFVKLSQSLQVQLEEIRNSENELRWQPEEDHSECQRCHSQFSVTWRKHHCRHCGKLKLNNLILISCILTGKVLCKDCTNKTVYTGPHNRSSRVCDVCYTLLVKDSQPYFHSSVPDL
ncbi:unnamed protein product [Rotaria sp. Silwood2]|nr:unnamed protein product [Rotaria sp. Silwood2]